MKTTQSISLVHYRLYAVGDVPLASIPVRPAFRDFFSNPNWLKDACEFTGNLRWEAIRKLRRSDSSLSKASPTFFRAYIRELGQLDFSVLLSSAICNGEDPETRTMRLRKSEHYVTVEPDGYSEFIGSTKTPGIHQRNLALKDDRLNPIPIRLVRPVPIHAFDRRRRVAHGHLNLTFYSAGFVQVSLSITLINPPSAEHGSGSGLRRIEEAIEETQPWRDGGSWKWHCRSRQSSLADIAEATVSRVGASLFDDGHPIRARDRWYSILRVAETREPRSRYSTFRREYFPYDESEETLASDANLESEGGDRTWNGVHIGSEDPDFVDETYRENAARVRVRLLKRLVGLDALAFPMRDADMYSNGAWTVCWLDQDSTRKMMRRGFRVAQTYLEFTVFKFVVLGSYIEYLRDETAKLKELRLNPRARIHNNIFVESIGRTSRYEANIHYHVLALDSAIRYETPFCRALYSFFSKSVGFDERRAKFQRAYAEWEAEVAKWESPLVTAQKMTGPLQTLFRLLRRFSGG